MKNIKIFNKKKGQILAEQTIFIILNLVYFLALLYFVIRAGSNSTAIEQVYSKEIALVIDKSNAGTNISLDVSKLYKSALKNEYEGAIVRIDNNENKVIVNLVSGKGYQYYFYTNNNVLWDMDKENKRLILTIV